MLGSATPVLVALLARRVAAGVTATADRAGLIAGTAAAAYPMLWVADGSLMSETTYGVLVTGTLLAAVHAGLKPNGGALRADLQALIGLAALTRGEAIGLLVVLVAPLARHARSWRLGGAALVATALVLAPWTARNLATFGDPVLISTNSYGVWAGANYKPADVRRAAHRLVGIQLLRTRPAQGTKYARTLCIGGGGSTTPTRMRGACPSSWPRAWGDCWTSTGRGRKVSS